MTSSLEVEKHGKRNEKVWKTNCLVETRFKVLEKSVFQCEESSGASS